MIWWGTNNQIVTCALWNYDKNQKAFGVVWFPLDENRVRGLGYNIANIDNLDIHYQIR